MGTIHQLPRPSKIIYYAHLGDVEGTAELLTGSGYLFRPEGSRKAVLVDYRNVELALHGRKDLADAQRAADGNLIARICGY